jgi:hypothetical protein
MPLAELNPLLHSMVGLDQAIQGSLRDINTQLLQPTADYLFYEGELPSRGHRLRLISRYMASEMEPKTS